MNRVELVNAGGSGNNTADILKRLPDVLELKPDLVILMVGTNDMLNSFNFVAPADYEKNLREIIVRLQAANAGVILMTIAPCLDACLRQRHGEAFFREQSPSRKVEAANAIIRRIAEERKLPLVDIHQLLVDAAGGIGEQPECPVRNLANCGEADGVHLTPVGYALVAGVVYRRIRELGHDFRKIVCLGDSITYGVHVAGAGTVTGECYPGQLQKKFVEQK